ncbi:MAG TPA: D-alanyl-D-alanine endopeptidase, partial [Candidatus Polarisedimenticolia bacterium]|nr:D-alanyl-D-alanine endopeptidase [Candidatus Polarisedimenticolia bacterium]
MSTNWLSYFPTRPAGFFNFPFPRAKFAAIFCRDLDARRTGWGAPLNVRIRSNVASLILAFLLVPVATVSPTQAAVSQPHRGPVPRKSPEVRSNLALVWDESEAKPLYAKRPEQVAPIASITKLMTAMVVLDAGLPLDEPLAIEKADIDRVKYSKSRLPVGGRLARGELLRVALMSSDNRAAAALGRTFPGGTSACVLAMNRKAMELGMTQSRFEDTSGLSSGNVSSAGDLSRMVRAAMRYPEIREATTTAVHRVTFTNGRVLEFRNSNGLVSNKSWDIGLSKTGYINEAGRCLVMQATIAAREVVIVLLDSWGKNTRLGDANRIRHWMEASLPRPGNATAAAPTGATTDATTGGTAAPTVSRGPAR